MRLPKTKKHMITACSFPRIQLLLKDSSVEIEFKWISGRDKGAPLIVFLHEGLGSIAMWKDWPVSLCKATGCRGLIFSRYGYGRSSCRPGQWPVDYLKQEATELLPALLDALNIDVLKKKPILFGHSDGGTIALHYAAAYPNAVAALVTVAPHIFVEEVSLAAIAATQQDFATGNLRKKLKRFHENPDAVFWGWSNRWQSDDFRKWDITNLLPKISCPVLAVQGAQDKYGTLEHLHRIKQAVPQATLTVIDDCGHVPHKDQPQALLNTVTDFLQGICLGYTQTFS